MRPSGLNIIEEALYDTFVAKNAIGKQVVVAIALVALCIANVWISVLVANALLEDHADIWHFVAILITFLVLVIIENFIYNLIAAYFRQRWDITRVTE